MRCVPLCPLSCSELLGTRDSDLSDAELQECWDAGAVGASRVGREAFGKVWSEVQEYFEGDIMDEARDPYSADARAGIETSGRGPTDTPPMAGTHAPVVGQNLPPEQLKAVTDQVKNMSDDDMTKMFEQMENMGPAEEARLRAMGVDPGMMKKSVEMMKSNPLMRQAAKAMVSKMSPEQLKKAGEQAQSQMANMTPEQLEEAMKRMK